MFFLNNLKFFIHGLLKYWYILYNNYQCFIKTGYCRINGGNCTLLNTFVSKSVLDCEIFKQFTRSIPVSVHESLRKLLVVLGLLRDHRQVAALVEATGCYCIFKLASTINNSGNGLFKLGNYGGYLPPLRDNII